MPMPQLSYTPEVAAETAPLYERVKRVIPEIEWPVFAPCISAINRVKREKRAVILAHNYMTPEIYHCVADFVGDSLQLAREAAKTDAGIIVQAGVRFMAETAKVLSPEKKVLIPDELAGCSLASSITARDVRALKRAHPGLPVVSYVNTSAEVKAESDICCTSANAADVVEFIAAERGVESVIMIPDEYLARNVAAQTPINIITWNGHCEVHERFSAADIRELRSAHSGLVVLAHPECPPEVIAAADFAGSTAAMGNYITSKKPARVALITECSMSDNLAVDAPSVEFIRPCNLCPHMKRITLAGILEALQRERIEITVDPLVSVRARAAVEAMLKVRPRAQRRAA
ncbi:MAG: quinolinate synthase NadA [Alphaproteobacteria bacterium]|nr:quinolinate synthase NadA [Alphaproteobacteria bacterium]